MEVFPLALAFVFGTIFLLTLLLLLILRYQSDPASHALVAQIKNTQSTIECFYAWGRCQVSQLNGGDSSWKGFIVAVKASEIVAVKADEIVIYPRRPKVLPPFQFTPDQIRWFGRPQKYSTGRNDLWLHLERGDGWHLLKFRLHQGLMRDLVRGLKAVASEELVMAYRRRRPYIHIGPLDSQPATQDIHGAWTLDEPVTLYLMPRFLIILQQTTVLRKIPLESVQQIGAFQRLDQPGAQGLVRFRAEEETLAFAVEQHDAFATALAEAAKRTLEEPIMQKQKKKDDEDEDW